MSTGVTFVRSEEFSICAAMAPDVLRYVMGFGGTPDSALTDRWKILTGSSCSRYGCVSTEGFAADPSDPHSSGEAVVTAPT